MVQDLISIHFTFRSVIVETAPFSSYSMAETSNQNNQIRGRQKKWDLRGETGDSYLNLNNII